MKRYYKKSLAEEGTSLYIPKLRLFITVLLAAFAKGITIKVFIFLE